MCMNFLLVEWNNDDEYFISGEEKITEFFNVCDDDKTGIIRNILYYSPLSLRPRIFNEYKQSNMID